MTARVEEPVQALPLEEENKSLVLFKEYVRQLKQGDMIQASANLTTLKSLLHGEDLNDPFWKERLPESQRMMLLVGVLCASCHDGACANCKGRRACPTCNGMGLCKDCGGKGGDIQVCTACVCRICSGQRFCQECKGRRYVNCPTCGGAGNGQTDRKFEPCASCGGRGYKEGLKGPNGSSKLKCLRCNGDKGFYTTVHSPCAACGGKGRILCTACGGSGSCAACHGLGRASECRTCSGQGRFLDPCKTCNGEKKCVDCGGTTFCKVCKGRGACVDCAGRSLVIRYRMPIDKSWLAIPSARIVQPGTHGIVIVPLTGTAASFPLSGRTVTADVSSDQVLWASLPEDLRQVSALFAP